MWITCKMCGCSIQRDVFCIDCRMYFTRECLDKVINENRELWEKLEVLEVVTDIQQYKLDKVTAQRKALAISCKNIIRGGVDALKESQKANKELIDHANNLAADAVEGILGQK